MRKILVSFVWCAIAVLALSACKREPVATVNPTYDADANTVKAEFVLNLSTPATNAATKTTSEFAQAGSNPTFLGMEAVHLLAYDLGERNFYYVPTERDGETVKKFPATRDFDLGDLFGSGEVSAQKASRSVTLALPLRTNAMLLYGKAKKTSTDDLQGAVNTEGDVKDLSTIKFSLVPRLSSEDAFDGFTFLACRLLNSLICAGLVNETTFWQNPTGTQDRSYAFWWPIDANTPTDTKDDLGNPLANGATKDGYTYHKGQISWKQLGQMYDYAYDGSEATNPETIPSPNMALSPLGEALGEAYSVFTTVVQRDTYKELRAGSASSLLRTMEDLYTVVLKVATVDATGWEEYVSKMLAEQMIYRMNRVFDYEGSHLYYLRQKNANGEGVPNTVDLTAIKTVAESFGNPSEWSSNLTKVNLVDDTFFPIGDNAGFPVNLGLPYGAACLSCTVVNDLNDEKKTVDKFSYLKEIPAYGMGEATFPIANYRYQPELMYYGNSPIRVSDSVVDEYPLSVSAWDTDVWSGWSIGRVASTTRSVAMVNHINYGTALLKTKVSYAEGLTALEDNNAYIHPGEKNNKIAVNAKSNAGFVVTGVIIGGQPDVVCWDYTRAPDDMNVVWKWNEEQQLFTDDNDNVITFNNNKFDKMIYDKVVRETDYVIGHNNSDIYTMAWDNYDATLAADSQSDVYIALEILNDTGSDFWGELNLVRNGGTFYLIGKLDMATAKKPASFNPAGLTNYNYPPFKTTDGSTVNAPRVFMQNYVTSANIVLGPKALQHAYLTMPDLRSSQISLGLVIDLTWQDGLEFNVSIGNE